ncbi:glycosyltransferase [Motilimonas eburnea]|nr:glycosyltransferase [Motilimonas eburnea]
MAMPKPDSVQPMPAAHAAHHSRRAANMPSILVLSSLFPSQARPTAGLFIQERMFRVAAEFPLFVVSPVPWFPLQGLIQWWRPHYRPQPANFEVQTAPDGSLVHVYFPRFFSLPGVGRCFDAWFMARAVSRWLKRHPELDWQILDSHFSYPEGAAAGLLSKWFRKPVTLTLRGTEVPHSLGFFTARWQRWAWRQADRVFAVSTSLQQLALGQGASPAKSDVVGNGVDCDTFYPVDKQQARAALGLAETDQVLITVAGLVPRKGFHLVIDALAQLPDSVKYVIVGGASAEGDYQLTLEQQVARLGLSSRVLFVGPKPKSELRHYLSAADLFVLASANEGWANVILEAMACGVPVLASDVGGNREVIANEQLGLIYPYGDQAKLLAGIEQGLAKHWQQETLYQYAKANSWQLRVEQLKRHFLALNRSEQGSDERES